MAEQASGEPRIALIRGACEAAEQAGFRPELARARFALGLALADLDGHQAVKELENAAQLFSASGLQKACAAVTDALAALADAAPAHARTRVTT